jgi:hypothetical protein
MLIMCALGAGAAAPPDRFPNDFLFRVAWRHSRLRPSQRIDALVAVDYLVTIHRDRFAALAARFGVPVIYHLGEIVEAGGLISYGASLSGAFYSL